MFIFTGGREFWAFGNFCFVEIWFGPVPSLLGEFWQLWYPFEFWPFYLCVQGFMPFPGCVSHDFRNLPASRKIILMRNSFKVWFPLQEPKLQPCWFPLNPAEVKGNFDNFNKQFKAHQDKQQIIFPQWTLHQFQKGVILYIDLVGKNLPVLAWKLCIFLIFIGLYIQPAVPLSFFFTSEDLVGCALLDFCI